MTRETLGEAQSGSDESEYVAGLLHDVGKIIMVAAFPEYFEQIQAGLGDQKMDLLRMETAMLGINHCELGALYLSAHKLPAATIQAVRFHHHPDSATADIRLVAAVQVADLFVRHAAIGNSGNPEEVTADAWVTADGWNHLFPDTTAERAIARANMERSLERLSTILEGLV
jgi:HD-like signal output (HDOD) protein